MTRNLAITKIEMSVQPIAEGTINGKPFFFIAKYGRCRFDVLTPAGYDEDPEWEHVEDYPGTAGMSQEEVVRMIELCALKYLEGKA